MYFNLFSKYSSTLLGITHKCRHYRYELPYTVNTMVRFTIQHYPTETLNACLVCMKASSSLTSSGLMTKIPFVPYTLKLLFAVTEFNEICITFSLLVLSALNFKSYWNCYVEVTTVYVFSNAAEKLVYFKPQ